jgi:hypothetical protein
VAGEELRRLAAAAQAYPRDLVDDAADTVEAAVTDSLLADTGGDASLSHAPADLSVTVRVSGSSTVHGKITAAGGTGQWTWLEEGTQPHLIGSRLHPGTMAKETWSRATTPEMRAVSADASERFSAMMSGD